MPNSNLYMLKKNLNAKKFVFFSKRFRQLFFGYFIYLDCKNLCIFDFDRLTPVACFFSSFFTGCMFDFVRLASVACFFSSFLPTACSAVLGISDAFSCLLPVASFPAVDTVRVKLLGYISGAVATL